MAACLRDRRRWSQRAYTIYHLGRLRAVSGRLRALPGRQAVFRRNRHLGSRMPSNSSAAAEEVVKAHTPPLRITGTPRRVWLSTCTIFVSTCAIGWCVSVKIERTSGRESARIYLQVPESASNTDSLRSYNQGCSKVMDSQVSDFVPLLRYLLRRKEERFNNRARTLGIEAGRAENRWKKRIARK